ncbi:hypothetical protein DS745_10265 [Anaerobacillus alkaliphilus]|uniref:Uncharacterized protein n=1 Tax=Anaerobacillus alkaliphilus TaxID=1548597 RepID=A0A4Q0VU69_9BACI|nr:hypothetical protein [Anaerobacillus alkaliphilus]RXJ01849.1 hypothetical protein DS745_10265 [Anaerobacillus alkaliphilus]
MKKIVVWIVVILLLCITTVLGKEIVYEDELKENYYELIVLVGELFKDHAQEDDYYYNRSYSKQEDMAELLGENVTDAGFSLLVDALFDELDELYVYKSRYQDYISDTRDFSKNQKATNYYDTVRNTILNPALGLIPFDNLEITREKNRVKVEGQEIKVEFYDARDYLVEHHQYARFGYPPNDEISFSLIFIYNDGKYLLDHFDIRSHGM